VRTQPVKTSDELVHVLAPGIGQSILVGWNGVPAASGPISDNHGIWFGSHAGIWLYSEANGILKVSNQARMAGQRLLLKL
jgi:hypothetical protein